MGEILAQHNFTEAHWRRVEELNAAGITAKVVISQIGQHQQRVSGSRGKCHVGGSREESSSVPGLGTHRSQPENKQHKKWHDQGKQHGAAAEKVADFLFEN